MDVECPVCFEKYDLNDRKPKGLHCGHDLCSQCVKNLTEAGTVQCPICRSETTAACVNTNFGMVKFLRSKCEVCNERMRSARCHHCGKELCGSCVDAHARTLYAEVKGQIAAIHREMKGAMDQSSDQTLLNNEIQSKEHVIKDIKRVVKRIKDDVDRSEAKLIEEVTRASDLNMDKHKCWVKELDSNIARCGSFALSVENQLGLRMSEECSAEQMAKLNTEAKEMFEEIQVLRDGMPSRTPYRFVPSLGSPLSVGDVVSQTAAVDYARVISKAVAGSKGSGAEQFERRAQLCVMSDSVVVADTDNHRIKLYNRNLDLLCVIGEKGSGTYSFNLPAAVCNFRDECFVSDEINHRIKVFNHSGQLLRMFGSRGAGEAEFDSPLGLAAGPGGYLYVCDARNYRVKVMTLEGQYVQSIGSKGTGPGHFREFPQQVAVTSGGMVCVIGSKHSNVLMYDTSGEYVRPLIKSIPRTTNPLFLTGITADQHNRIILADYNNARLLVMDTSGHLISTIGTRGNQRGQLIGPWDVAISDLGDIVVYEAGNHRLQVFQIAK